MDNFHYTVMLSALKSTSATYQQAMTIIFHGMLHDYLDDYVDDTVLKFTEVYIHIK